MFYLTLCNYEIVIKETLLYSKMIFLFFKVSHSFIHTGGFISQTQQKLNYYILYFSVFCILNR